MKNNFITALMVVAVMAAFNQFDATRSILNGGNRYFK